MTTIKEHIEAGHYQKKDDYGFTVVPSDSGEVHVVTTSGPRDDFAIVGFRTGTGALGWNANGHPYMYGPSGCELLPPPPRKVKVTRYILAPVKGGSSHCVFETREDALKWGPLSGENVVELTGEYEEPWS